MAWMVYMVMATLPGGYMASAMEAAPQLLPQDWPEIAIAILVSSAGGPGQPAQRAPGLPANIYSGDQASGLSEIFYSGRDRRIIK